MDFGDILDNWDKQTAKAGKKKRKPQKYSSAHNDEDKEENAAPKSPHPLDIWLNRNGIFDKDAAELNSGDSTRADGRTFAGERRSRLLRMKPEANIDLHGLKQDEAWTALEAFFENSRRKGLEKVLIIHGKGNHRNGTFTDEPDYSGENGNEGLLKELSKRFIESCPFAGESGHGPAKDGGTGATWVILKETTFPGK